MSDSDKLTKQLQSKVAQSKGGPIIGPAPQPGSDRSRKKLSQWRKKRSAAGVPRKTDSVELTKISKSRAPRDNGGPLVEKGPTAGQVRSRTKLGRWRKKRSDAGVPRKKD